MTSGESVDLLLSNVYDILWCSIIKRQGALLQKLRYSEVYFHFIFSQTAVTLGKAASDSYFTILLLQLT